MIVSVTMTPPFISTGTHTIIINNDYIIIYYIILLYNKMGRYIEMKDKKRGLPVSIYLEAQQAAALEEIHWRERKSVSELVRIAVSDYIKAHGSGNDTFKLDNWNKDPTFQAVPTILSENEKWLSYLESCTPEERRRILKQSNTIRQFVISIGDFGVRKK